MLKHDQCQAWEEEVARLREENEKLQKENEGLRNDLAYLLMSYAKQIDDDFREIVKSQVRSINDKWFKGEKK